ncbi:MAG: xylulose kinase [Caldilineales bacterium]|nr:xylulose kinase [Caldilineales bacterium]MCW5859258.1 xylulose kinase [Caldilineales bacterium]
MAQNYFIGIDNGSSFTKSSIIDTEGHVLADARRDTHPHQPRAGVAEYDGPTLLRAMYESVAELLQKSGVKPEAVAAVCLDAMISGTMGVDDAGDATTPYTTTLDQRFTPQLNRILDRFHDPIRELTGSGQPTIAPKMLWIREEFPDVYRRTAKFVTISGYLLGKMAGLTAQDAVVDTTYLWATGLADAQNYVWSDDLCRMMDLPVDKLPRIVRSFDIIGGVCAEAAAATGLRQGTPIVAGAADQSAGYIGAGITKANRMASNSGTYPVLAICTDQFRPDMQNRMSEIIPSVIPGLWNPTSYIIGGGLSHHWFQETFAHADEMEGQAQGRSVYEVLDDKAAALPPGSEKLIFLPHLGGRACPMNTDLKGAWFGFTWTHRRQHFYRAILEAIAYDQFLQLQAYRASNPDLQVAEITAYGGGAKSALWNQIRADVMGLPLALLGREDLAPIGNAILAGYALGLYDDMAAAAERFVTPTARVEPDPARHEHYRPLVDFYARLLAASEPLFADLAVL